MLPVGNSRMAENKGQNQRIKTVRTVTMADYFTKDRLLACKRLHYCILLIFSKLQRLKCNLLNICILYDLPFNKLISALNIYTFDRLT